MDSADASCAVHSSPWEEITSSEHVSASGGDDAEEAAKPSAPAAAAAPKEDIRRRKEQHVPLPLSLALRLVHDENFKPGVRPAQLDDSSDVWVFKEVQRIKRKGGCDAWVNSGGVRGGRNLQNMSGEVVLRRRYGKVLAASDGGRRGKLTGNERRYQEYTILTTGPDGELVENRDIRL
jgi:hypothetical protein